jgi:hypothetical protein
MDALYDDDCLSGRYTDNIPPACESARHLSDILSNRVDGFWLYREHSVNQIFKNWPPKASTMGIVHFPDSQLEAIWAIILHWMEFRRTG